METETVAKIIRDNNLNLPGSDIAKTSIYLVFPLLLLILTTDNPFLPESHVALERYQEISFLLLIGSMFLCISSGIVVNDILSKKPSEINKFCSLFYGKIFLNLSVMLFFFVVCMWVMVLGGILSSPFAMLLAMSPILLTIQYFRDRHVDYQKLVKILGKYICGNPNCTVPDAKTVKMYVEVTASIPIFVVIVTLSVGQFFVETVNLPNYLLTNELENILKTNWYYVVYYLTYYLSIIIASFGVLPSKITRNLIKKIL